MKKLFEWDVAFRALVPPLTWNDSWSRGKLAVLKVLCTLLVLALFSTNCLADELDLDTETQYQKQLMQTGFRILNANLIEKRMTFYYSPENKVKIKNNQRNKKIILYKGFIPYFDDENELAALLSTQIAYMYDVERGIFKRVAMGFSPRKYEIKSDKRAVDYMVNAGYNPIALIVIMNKYKSQPNFYEANPMEHTGLECMTAVYEHIYEKYPAFIAKNEYIDNIYYQNFLHVSKPHRAHIRKSKEVRVKLRKQNLKENI